MKKVLKTTIGENLSAVLSRTLVRHWYSAIGEFFVNGYDEDAENMSVTLDTGLEQIVIEDDGLGMDREGLRDFFRRGDSKKLTEPFSPTKKRRRIGRYGLAKLLLKYVGSEFELESVRDEISRVVDSGQIKGRVIPVAKSEAKGRKNGTKITIHGLKFKFGEEEGQFSQKRLVNELEWNIPNASDFNVFVNGQQIRRRGIIEGARMYELNEKVDGNPVTGRIYWSEGTEKLEGVRILVDKRPVGSHDMFELRNISFAMDGKTAGEINADFLRELVTLDRTQIQDDPRLDEVKRKVTRLLYSIKEDLAKGKGKRAFYNNRKTMEVARQALRQAEEQLNLAISHSYSLEFAPEQKSGPIAQINEDVISINPNNRMFSFLKAEENLDVRESQIYLRKAFLIAAAFALMGADHKLARMVREESEAMIRKYKRTGEIIGRYMEGRQIAKLGDIYLCQYRLYDANEVSDLTGRHPVVVRLLHTCGALKGTDDHLFRKRDLIEALTPLEGYVSCIEVADGRYQDEEVDWRKEKRVRYDSPKATETDEELEKIGKELAKYEVINVGKVHPFYFVPVKKAERFREFLIGRGVYHE